MPMMFFYFLKIIFDISTSKRSKKYKPHSILAKKKNSKFNKTQLQMQCQTDTWIDHDTRSKVSDRGLLAPMTLEVDHQLDFNGPKAQPINRQRCCFIRSPRESIPVSVHKLPAHGALQSSDLKNLSTFEKCIKYLSGMGQADQHVWLDSQTSHL
jgi:hypothetical protein